MQTNLNKSQAPEVNITKTGYRALFILMKLIEKPLSRDEILECLSADPIAKKDFSKDTITNTINALRLAGCIISRPTLRTGNKYILKSHPFGAILTTQQVEALQNLRENIVSTGDWELLIYLNNLYAKIARLTPDNETKNLLLNKHPLRNIDYKLINKLLFCAKTNHKLNITYLSPQNGEENFDFAPEYLTFENEKLYVWGHNKKHNEFSFLRVDRIKKINSATFITNEDKAKEFPKEVVCVQYKLKGYSAQTYAKNEHEKILQEYKNDEYSLLISANVTNKFNFFQRILSFGTDCLIISPDKIKQEFVDTLKRIKRRYDAGE